MITAAQSFNHLTHPAQLRKLTVNFTLMMTKNQALNRHFYQTPNYKTTVMMTHQMPKKIKKIVKTLMTNMSIKLMISVTKEPNLEIPNQLLTRMMKMTQISMLRAIGDGYASSVISHALLPTPWL